MIKYNTPLKVHPRFRPFQETSIHQKLQGPVKELRSVAMFQTKRLWGESLERKLDKKRKRIESLHREIRELRRDFIDVRKENAELQSLREEVEELQSLRKYITKLRSLQKEVKALQSLREETTELRREVKEFQSLREEVTELLILRWEVMELREELKKSTQLSTTQSVETTTRSVPEPAIPTPKPISTPTNSKSTKSANPHICKRCQTSFCSENTWFQHLPASRKASTLSKSKLIKNYPAWASINFDYASFRTSVRRRQFLSGGSLNISV